MSNITGEYDVSLLDDLRKGSCAMDDFEIYSRVLGGQFVEVIVPDIQKLIEYDKSDNPEIVKLERIICDVYVNKQRICNIWLCDFEFDLSPRMLSHTEDDIEEILIRNDIGEG